MLTPGLWVVTRMSVALSWCLKMMWMFLGRQVSDWLGSAVRRKAQALLNAPHPILEEKLTSQSEYRVPRVQVIWTTASVEKEVMG